MKPSIPHPSLLPLACGALLLLLTACSTQRFNMTPGSSGPPVMPASEVTSTPGPIVALRVPVTFEESHRDALWREHEEQRIKYFNDPAPYRAGFDNYLSETVLKNAYHSLVFYQFLAERFGPEKVIFQPMVWRMGPDGLSTMQPLQGEVEADLELNFGLYPSPIRVSLGRLDRLDTFGLWFYPVWSLERPAQGNRILLASSMPYVDEAGPVIYPERVLRLKFNTGFWDVSSNKYRDVWSRRSNQLPAPEGRVFIDERLELLRLDSNRFHAYIEQESPDFRDSPLAEFWKYKADIVARYVNRDKRQPMEAIASSYARLLGLSTDAMNEEQVEWLIGMMEAEGQFFSRLNQELTTQLYAGEFGTGFREIWLAELDHQRSLQRSDNLQSMMMLAGGVVNVAGAAGGDLAQSQMGISMQQQALMQMQREGQEMRSAWDHLVAGTQTEMQDFLIEVGDASQEVTAKSLQELREEFRDLAVTVLGMKTTEDPTLSTPGG